jgi:hypothetical protein
MQMTLTLFLAAALLAYAFGRRLERIKPGLHQDLRWWQRPLVLVAVIAALLIVLNPEFLALGLVGDTAFFDLLVLLVSLQLQSLTMQARSWLADLLSKVKLWFMTPRMSYLLVLEVRAAVGDLISSIAAAWHQISGLSQKMV